MRTIYRYRSERKYQRTEKLDTDAVIYTLDFVTKYTKNINLGIIIKETTLTVC